MNFKKWFLIISLSLLSIFSFSSTFAFNQYKTDTNSKTDLLWDIAFYQTIWQSLYAITWPLISVAGVFINNQVVYGSFLGLDNQLRKMWNIFRTFANYIIGFILIFSIFSLFLGWKFDKFNPTKLLPQLAVSAVLVNMSWFLIGVCIDFSNILTYAVWQLPLKMSDKTLKDIYTGSSITKVWIKFENDNKAFKIGVVDKDWNIIPFCKFVWTWDNKLLVKPTEENKKNNTNKKESYCAYLCNWKYYKLKAGDIISLNKCKWDPIENTITKQEKDKLSKNLMGPFYAIYGGLLNVGRMVTFSEGSPWTATFEILFKLIFLIALLIPLFVLTIILVVRVVYIWMYIVVSPFIFLFTSLKDIWWKILWEKWNFKNMCCVIFMPVFVTFALSLSFVFLSAIAFIKTNWGKGFLDYLWIKSDTNKNCIIAQPLESNENWNIKICAKLNSTEVVDTNFSNFDKFILMIIKWIFWIAFMWIIVFTALKSCKLTEKIASSVQVFAQGMLKATPIIPVAGWQSVWSLAQAVDSLTQLPGKWQENQFTKKIQPWIEEIQRRTSGVEQKAIETANKDSKALTTLNVNTSSISKKISNSTDKDYKKILGTEFKNLKDKQKSYLASQLGIDLNDFNKIVTHLNISNKKVRDLLNNPDFKGEILKILSKKHLEEFIRNKVLDKKITLLQLSDEAKNYLKTVFNKVWYPVDKISKNSDLAKALLKLWFKKDEIIRLLASNLEWDKVKEEERKEIENLLK